ncbi:MAG: SAVED domain-containing protein [Chloroflexota bacterium]
MNIWDWLGRTSDILGVLTVIFSGYAAYRLWRQNQRFRALARELQQSIDIHQRIKDYEGVQTANPVALAISLLPTVPSIKENVNTYLKIHKLKMPIEEVSMLGVNGTGDLETLVRTVQNKKIDIQSDGFTEVHLFLAGPVAAGVIIGSLLNNWVPVKIYHKPTPSPAAVYEYWMPLFKI